MDYLFKPIVLVTGFGPFVNHPVNASWEAVKLMNKEELERRHNIELVQIEIPVTYQNVDEFVPALWETHEPKLMIHVGVSSIASEMTLELQAHRKGYQKLDYFNELPANHTCPAEGAIRLHTQLNVERICKEYNNSCPAKTTAVSSLDAGRYLCEYIYYTSLSHDNTRTLFVHVPDVLVYAPERSARGLERILDLCMAQILEAEEDVADQLERARISDNEAFGFQSTPRSLQNPPVLKLFNMLSMTNNSNNSISNQEELSDIYNPILNSSSSTLRTNDIISSDNTKANDSKSKDDYDSSGSFDKLLKKALDFRTELLKPK